MTVTRPARSLPSSRIRFRPHTDILSRRTADTNTLLSGDPANLRQELDITYYFDNHLNMKSTGAVSALAALAQDTRLDVFRLLVQQGRSGLAAGEIAQHLGVSPATLSFHLKELAHAKLVTSRQDGRFVFYAANFGAMNSLLAFLTENCCAADGGTCAPNSSACAVSTNTSKSRRKATA